MFIVKRPKYLLFGNYVLVVYHLLLLPVVSALPAAEWIKAAGYIWIFLDTALGIAEINGLKPDDVWALRMGSHIPCAVWIVGSSFGMHRFALITGLVLGGILGIHALLAPRVPKWALLPAVPVMFLWLLMAGHQLR
jgi:hypothetical protein